MVNYMDNIIKKQELVSQGAIRGDFLYVEFVRSLCKTLHFFMSEELIRKSMQKSDR